MLVTGSVGLNILAEDIRSLAGRTIYHELKPFSFREYLIFREIDIDPSKPLLYEDKLTREFSYFLKRPFPELVNESDE